ILVAQVPGGMLTNLESQLKQQNAAYFIDTATTEISTVPLHLGRLSRLFIANNS
ncbi:hypothetical protein JGG16_23250, partial [Salmonella enterica subsp. enterica serovar London]|nr:hypothetical protein [Salmonella enterica subsp. enterica serovar London]